MPQFLLLHPGIGKRELRTGIIIRQLRNMLRFFDRRIMVPDIPDVYMRQNSPNDVRLFDKGDDLHGALAFRA